MSVQQSLTANEAQSLLAQARQAARHAYAPYSQFPVGAALLLSDGTVVTGVNVENISYGLTLCAERVAMTQAVAQGHRQFQALAVWAEKMPQGAVMPCGACRQVLAEFLSKDALVITAHPVTGDVELTPLGALLPRAFDSLNNNTPGDSEARG